MTGTLKQEIKQKRPFRSVQEEAVLALMRTADLVAAPMSELLRANDLSMSQYNILRILRGQKEKPATVKLLTERMLDKSSNASRLVDKLLEKGLVKRVSCPNDRRAVEVTITTEGLRVLEEIAASHPHGPTPGPGLSEDEARVLSDLLDRLRETLASN